MKECLIHKNYDCNKCFLYKLMRGYKILEYSYFENMTCLQRIDIYLSCLYEEFFKKSNYDKEIEAIKVISFVHEIFIHYNGEKIIRLCAVVMKSIISRGLTEKGEIERAEHLRIIYMKLLNQYVDIVKNKDIYLDLWLEYANIFVQIKHLQGDFKKVINVYEDLSSYVTGDTSGGRELNAHYSASLYLQNSKKNKLKSREEAEKLFELIDENSELKAEDYFILSKFLEHYIQIHEEREGLEKIKPYMSYTYIGDIVSIEDAIYRAIFNRDIYWAYTSIGEHDIANKYYIQAINIAKKYNIIDQENKIKNKKKELEEKNIEGNYFGVTMIDASNNKGTIVIMPEKIEGGISGNSKEKNYINNFENRSLEEELITYLENKISDESEFIKFQEEVKKHKDINVKKRKIKSFINQNYKNVKIVNEFLGFFEKFKKAIIGVTCVDAKNIVQYIESILK